MGLKWHKYVAQMLQNDIKIKLSEIHLQLNTSPSIIVFHPEESINLSEQITLGFSLNFYKLHLFQVTFLFPRKFMQKLLGFQQGGLSLSK